MPALFQKSKRLMTVKAERNLADIFHLSERKYSINPRGQHAQIYKGKAVVLKTVRSANNDCICATPGSRAKD